MADLKLVVETIGKALGDAIPGLQVMTVPGQISPPAAQIEATAVDFGEAMKRGHERWDITVRVLVATASEQGAQDELYKYFGQAKDIKNAIEDEVELQDGTVAHGVFVRGARNFALYEVNAVAYRGVEFNVDVYA